MIRRLLARLLGDECAYPEAAAESIRRTLPCSCPIGYTFWSGREHTPTSIRACPVHGDAALKR